MAQAQQILGQALGQIEFPAESVISSLRVGHSKKHRRTTQLLPQRSCADMSMAGLRRRESFNGMEHSAQGSAKVELLSLPFRGVGQQRQLVQPILQLGGRLRHSREGSGATTRLGPAGDGFLNEPGLGVMLSEE